eukprot:scaffold4060_cov190-Amphora_coffeaeformis.AAC.24
MKLIMILPHMVVFLWTWWLAAFAVAASPVKDDKATPSSSKVRKHSSAFKQNNKCKKDSELQHDRQRQEEALLVSYPVTPLTGTMSFSFHIHTHTHTHARQYEIWGSDQSNSIEGQGAGGINGGFLWIWNSTQVCEQLSGSGDAVPVSCLPDQANGPCNLLDMFPGELRQYNKKDEPTGSTLNDLGVFGRLHGVIKDPFDKYVNANFFVRGGAYLGIIDTETKEAIGLFRATSFNFGGTTDRSIHMSFWTTDGSAVIIANLHGKAIERIDVTRDKEKKIIGLKFNTAASVGLSKSMSVNEEATYFVGNNAFGRPLIGGIVGSYANADLNDLTPSGVCKETGCSGTPAAAGGRTNNLPICPIPSSNGLVYVTLAGGGLFILDSSTTPMRIVGEYGQAIVYGAGCGGIQTDNKVYINSGVSASGAGFDQSMFALYEFDDSKYSQGNQGENNPMPIRVFQDAGNTKSGGNVEPASLDSNDSGQLPGLTTRRDSHGAWTTLDGSHVHVVDRLQNVVEVFDTETYERTTYDLTSMNGKTGRSGPAGACFTRSVKDDPLLPLNDPAPDLFEITPDGKFFAVAFRGPVPVSVPHSAQGSCPGVGLIEITEGMYYCAART